MPKNGLQKIILNRNGSAFNKVMQIATFLPAYSKLASVCCFRILTHMTAHVFVIYIFPLFKNVFFFFLFDLDGLPSEILN